MARMLHLRRLWAWLFLLWFICSDAAMQMTHDERMQFNAVRNLFRITDDPDARVDTFQSMAPKVKQIWAGGQSETFTQLKAKLNTLEMEMNVDVVLIGFDGIDGATLDLDAYTLSMHLQHLPTKMEIRPLGFPDQSEKDLNETVLFRLGIRAEVRYGNVRPSKKTLKDIENAIFSAISAEEKLVDLAEKESGVVMISHDTVDPFIKNINSQNRLFPTIYILNPSPATHTPYVYRYETPVTGCPGNFWIASGEDSTSCYIWIDISAGPLKHGPLDVGTGQVMEHSFPRVHNYAERSKNRAIIPDLAAMIHSATQHLMLPTVLTLNLPEWKTLVIPIVHIHDAVIPDKASMHVQELEAAVRRIADISLKHQTIEVNNYYVSFSQCPACASAYHEAVQIGAGRVPGAGVVVHEMEFVEEMVLFKWLSDHNFQQDIRDNRNAEIRLHTDLPNVRILPVFVYELATMKPLTFRSGKQSVAFSNLIMAIRTFAGKYISDLGCAGHDVTIATANLSRPLVASILQTGASHHSNRSTTLDGVGWGIPDTAEAWSPARGKVKDYRWSVGHTPFGDMSTSTTMPNTLLRVAKRNYILALAYRQMREAIEIYTFLNMIAKSGLPSELFDKVALTEFVSRSNLIRSKMSVVLAHVGRGEFDTAHYFARSCKHDIVALKAIVDDLRSIGPQPTLACLNQRGKLNFWYCVGFGLVLFIVLYLLRKLRPVRLKPE